MSANNNGQPRKVSKYEVQQGFLCSFDTIAELYVYAQSHDVEALLFAVSFEGEDGYRTVGGGDFQIVNELKRALNIHLSRAETIQPD